MDSFLDWVWIYMGFTAIGLCVKTQHSILSILYTYYKNNMRVNYEKKTI